MQLILKLIAMNRLDQKFQEKGFTFDDVLLVPDYSETLPNDVSLKTKFSKKKAKMLRTLWVRKKKRA